MSPISRSTVALTTAAKASAMMRATASSTRLPRRVKFLNPDMDILLSGRPGDGRGLGGTGVTLAGNDDAEEVGRSGARDLGDLPRQGPDHDEPPGRRTRRRAGA